MHWLKWSVVFAFFFGLAAVTWMAAQTKAPKKPAEPCGNGTLFADTNYTNYWECENSKWVLKDGTGVTTAHLVPIWNDTAHDDLKCFEQIVEATALGYKDYAYLVKVPDCLKKRSDAKKKKRTAYPSAITPSDRLATLTLQPERKSKKPQANAQYIQLNRDDGTASVKLTTSDGNWFLGKSKLKNGQCPVCGEMHEVFKPTVENWFRPSVCLTRMSPDGNTAFASCFPPTVDDLPKGREVFCAKCRVKFWQDAEEVKK